MRLIFLISFLLNVCCSIQAQDTLHYSFKSRNNDSQFDYGYYRVIKKDSIFKEVGLFSKGDVHIFRIKNGNWYVLENKKWKLFYSKQKFTSPKVKIAGQMYILKPLTFEIIGGFSCTIFQATCKNGNVSGELKYWFSPEKGFIKIETSETVLYRNDINIQ
jgi:hypothetical protein